MCCQYSVLIHNHVFCTVTLTLKDDCLLFSPQLGQQIYDLNNHTQEYVASDQEENLCDFNDNRDHFSHTHKLQPALKSNHLVNYTVLRTRAGRETCQEEEQTLSLLAQSDRGLWERTVLGFRRVQNQPHCSLCPLYDYRL